jgi:bifunctional DNA primase/polymerase-like protein
MKITNQWLWAQDAIRRGWHIFPIEPGDKRGAFTHPGSPYRIQWYESATNNLDLAATWWEYNPEYNIGISAKKSGLLIVDCDTTKEDTVYDHGADQYQRLVKEVAGDWWWEKAIDTYQVNTPSGGLHLYYAWPDDVKASQRSLDSLLDVRSNGGEKGGYVVGAGSVTTQGPYYVPEGVPSPVQEAPSWLIELVRHKEPKRRLDEPFTKPYAVFDRYRGLREAITNAAEGNRNATLNWAIYQMVRDDPEGVHETHCLEEFREVALGAGLTDVEVTRTIHSAYQGARRG